MSSYLEVYLKDPKSKNLINLFSYSRSNAIYQSFYENFSGAYGKVIPMTASRLREWLDQILGESSSYKDTADTYRNRIKDVYLANNPLSEKMEVISDYENSIAEINQEIDYLSFAEGIVRSLMEIVDNYQYTDKINKDELIYAGIDVNFTDEENKFVVYPGY